MADITLEEARRLVETQDISDPARLVDAVSLLVRHSAIADPTMLHIAEQLERVAAAFRRGVEGALNGIPATPRHDEGAQAQCGYCRRYTANPMALGRNPPRCECGNRGGWSGSFPPPGPDAKWHGRAPAEKEDGDAQQP